VEEGEEEQKRKWLTRARQSFEQLLSAAYGGVHVDLEAYFNVVRIPHKSYFAYGEHIAATEQAANEFGSMAQAFQRLADALECVGAIEAQQVLSPRVLDEGLDALLQAFDIADKDGKLTKPGPRIFELTTIAHALLQRGRAKEAIALFDKVLRNSRDASELPVKWALVDSFLGKATALIQLGRITEALNMADDAFAHANNLDEPELRDRSVSAALIIFGTSNIRMGKQALQSGEETKAQAYLQRAESMLSAGCQRFPQKALLFGYSAYVAFLAGRQDESRALLTQAVELGGAKPGDALLKIVAIHPIPQDNEFRALLASIPDPQAGSAPSA
jgi:tetratricopeptide (TPR) repeat protein